MMTLPTSSSFTSFPKELKRCLSSDLEATKRELSDALVSKNTREIFKAWAVQHQAFCKASPLMGEITRMVQSYDSSNKRLGQGLYNWCITTTKNYLFRDHFCQEIEKHAFNYSDRSQGKTLMQHTPLIKEYIELGLLTDDELVELLCSSLDYLEKKYNTGSQQEDRELVRMAKELFTASQPQLQKMSSEQFSRIFSFSDRGSDLLLKQVSPELRSLLKEKREERYQADNVWERFTHGEGKTFAPQELRQISQEALHMARYAAENVENKAQMEQIQADIKHKAGGADLSQEAAFGKLFALSLKVVALIKRQESLMGRPLDPNLISKRTGKSYQPAQRLLHATPLLQRAIDPSGAVAGQGMLVLKELGQGAFNTAARVYHIQRSGTLVFRALDYPRMQAKSSNIADAEKDWETELVIHRFLMEQKVEGIVSLHEVYRLDADAASHPVRGLLLENCVGDLQSYVGSAKKPPARAPLSSKNRVSIIKQATSTVAQIHRLGMVHTDLKPGNLLFVLGPEDEMILKLSDFGLSVKAEDREGGRGTALFTPLDGFLKGMHSKIHAQKNDAWALGLIAYELKYGACRQHQALYSQLVREGQVLFEQFSLFLKQAQDHPAGERGYREQLIATLKRLYTKNPQVGPLLDQFMKKGDFYTLRTDPDFKHALYNTLVESFKGQFEAIFLPICTKLSAGDQEDQLIAKLLDPNIETRISVEEAAVQAETLEPTVAAASSSESEATETDESLFASAQNGLTGESSFETARSSETEPSEEEGFTTAEDSDVTES